MDWVRKTLEQKECEETSKFTVVIYIVMKSMSHGNTQMRLQAVELSLWGERGRTTNLT